MAHAFERGSAYHALARPSNLGGSFEKVATGLAGYLSAAIQANAVRAAENGRS